METVQVECLNNGVVATAVQTSVSVAWNTEPANHFNKQNRLKKMTDTTFFAPLMYYDDKAEETFVLAREVVNVERDSKEFVTVYYRNEQGKTYYVALPQSLIDKLKET